MVKFAKVFRETRETFTRDSSLNYKKNTGSGHVVYKYCFECQNKTKKKFLYTTCFELSCNSMNNLSSYCGLTDARMRASEKDLPVSFFTQQTMSSVYI